ncbi:MAG: chalcone isomerase family protein, partial [Vibrionaceae bacterium]|nr:chalcone isomerase family protein [Vibrionaceae bacterium]
AIDYQRDISSQQLLEATDEQWQKLGYQTPMRKQWLVQLKTIFPDIKKGQQLAYVTDGKTGQFYYQHKGQVDAIGSISDETLNDAFLAIWLSPNTQYPKLRKQLIGAK